MNFGAQSLSFPTYPVQKAVSAIKDPQTTVQSVLGQSMIHRLHFALVWEETVIHYRAKQLHRLPHGVVQGLESLVGKKVFDSSMNEGVESNQSDYSYNDTEDIIDAGPVSAAGGCDATQSSIGGDVRR